MGVVVRLCLLQLCFHGRIRGVGSGQLLVKRTESVIDLVERLASGIPVCLGCSQRRFCFHDRRLRLAAKGCERFVCRRLRSCPQRCGQFASRRLERIGQIRVLNPDAAFFPQVFPEFIERLGRRRHAAFAHELVQFVGCRRHPMAEEQQRADFAVQVLRVRKLLAQAVDLGEKLFFIGDDGVHGGFSAGYFNKYYYVLRCKYNYPLRKYDISIIMSNIVECCSNKTRRARDAHRRPVFFLFARPRSDRKRPACARP